MKSLFVKETIEECLKMLIALPGLARFYLDYGYDGKTCEFIIDNYEKVLVNRTKLMSKPTYCYRDVIAQLDEWYENVYNE